MKKIGLGLVLLFAPTIYGAPAPRVPITIQLNDVILRNDTGLTLQVYDEVRGPWGSRLQGPLYITPNQQHTLQWRGQVINAQTRRISVQAAVYGANSLTNKIIIGNTPDATVVPGGLSPAGSYTIENPNTHFITASVTGAIDAGAIRFPRTLQVWDVYVKNTSDRVLNVTDELQGPQGHFIHTFVLHKNEEKIMSWSQYLNAQKIRKIKIWGSCEGASKPTNVIVISNTPDATIIPEGGSPGGVYVIGNPYAGSCALVVLPNESTAASH